MKKLLFFLPVLMFIVCSCSKSSDDNNTQNSNTLTFDSTFNNVTMTGDVNGTKWQLNAVINLPAVGGFARSLAFNVKFLQKPTANASYDIVSTEAAVQSGTAMFYINHVDYNPSPTDNISNSYFLKTGTTGTISVSIVSGKVSVQFSSLTLTGNRGGGDKANVSGNLTEN